MWEGSNESNRQNSCFYVVKILALQFLSHSFIHLKYFPDTAMCWHFPKQWAGRDSNMAIAQGTKGTGLKQVLWGLKLLKFRVFFS